MARRNEVKVEAAVTLTTCVLLSPVNTIFRDSALPYTVAEHSRTRVRQLGSRFFSTFGAVHSLSLYFSVI